MNGRLLAIASRLGPRCEARLVAQRLRFQRQLAAPQASFSAGRAETVEAAIVQAHQAATLLDPDEAPRPAPSTGRLGKQVGGVWG
jgi:hypothetical protein